jgi:hypothetical protein
MTDLEELIRSYVHFRHRPNAKGWLPVVCKVCNDHGRKGPRAAFIFSPTSVGYHCFNCPAGLDYSTDQTEPLSDRTKQTLTAYGITAEDIQQINFKILQRADKLGIKPKAKRAQSLNIEMVTLDMPSYLIPLDQVTNDNPWKEVAMLYLKELRGIEPSSYPFHLGIKTEDPRSERWDKRLIIPSYKDDKLVYYEGRDLTGKQPKKYISADVPKSNIMYGFDQLFVNREQPLFVLEGFFDAVMVNGVALFGNTLYKETMYHLNSSPREKVVIPDRYGDGYKLAEQALKLGWKIATPEIGDAKDINEAVQRFGKLYVIKSIMNNIYSDFAAETHLRFYCVEYGKKKK